MNTQNKIKSYWRIFDDKNGLPHTLFHGVRGSRALKLDVWHEAEIKLVHDGTGQVRYQSGFHVLRTIDEVKIVLKQFKKLGHSVICRVWVDEDAGIFNKARSRQKVILVNKIKITKNDWQNRKRCGEIVEPIFKYA